MATNNKIDELCLFVNNLGDDVDVDQLKAAFEKNYRILGCEIKQAQRNSQRYGVVWFIHKKDVALALLCMDKKWIGSKPIGVKQYSPVQGLKESKIKENNGLQYNRIFEQCGPEVTTVYVKGVTIRTTEQSMRHTFSPYGFIEEVHFPPWKDYAFVRFRTKDSATRAIIGVKDVAGQSVKCSWARDQRQQNQPGRQTWNKPHHSVPSLRYDNRSLNGVHHQSAVDSFRQRMWFPTPHVPAASSQRTVFRNQPAGSFTCSNSYRMGVQANQCARIEATACQQPQPIDTSGVTLRGQLYEHDVWGAGHDAKESDDSWKNCVKDPEHKSYIPIKEFGIDNLPEECQNKDFVNMIFGVAYLTVRLRVSFKSPARPDDGGIYSKADGGRRVGTGFVYKVIPTKGRCPCTLCVDRQKGKSWTLFITTAKHVIFDDSEAQKTRVDFFYDYADAIKDESMESVKGVKTVDEAEEKDYCTMTCVTHDNALANQVKDALEELERSEKNLTPWLTTLNCRIRVIVSHPHGRPKKVTVGQWTDLEKDSTMESYTTATCKGSSGARVIGWLAGVNRSRVHHCQRGQVKGVNKGFYILW